MKKWILLLFTALSFNVMALDLQQAKEQGLIGERPDGMIGAVQASPEVNKIVASINAQRVDAYKKIAAKNGMTTDQVAILAGEKALQKTPSGQYILNGSGQWVKK
ncbi:MULTISPECIES: YdbL family protein [unclassified Motilimonas]|uniref:YdbL family protein n=1 Tax=Motilimonas TaxID=1914248 RepID=UPI001E338556|nr:MULTISPECIES: YdbL family protein [unclassified Motilimonas]MCE0555820.1 YdbL family protein [Motilimonas sp. E26]MDO6524131.1 YdbL family protein [Motilimonas sp. 1_MG-2023]